MTTTSQEILVMYSEEEVRFWRHVVGNQQCQKYFVEVELLGRRFIDFYNGYSLFYSIENNYRFNSKLLISHQISSNPRWNNIGFHILKVEARHLLGDLSLL